MFCFTLFLLQCSSFTYVDLSLTFFFLSLKSCLTFLNSQVYWQQIPSCFVWESISPLLLKNNFAGYRILGWWGFLVNTLNFTSLSCLHGFGEFEYNSYFCSSIGKVVFSIWLILGLFIFYFLCNLKSFCPCESLFSPDSL